MAAFSELVVGPLLAAKRPSDERYDATLSGSSRFSKAPVQQGARNRFQAASEALLLGSPRARAG